jgi:hypothetical protein
MSNSLQGFCPSHFLLPDEDFAFDHEAFPVLATQASVAGSSSVEQSDDSEKPFNAVSYTELLADENSQDQAQRVSSPFHSSNQDIALTDINADLEDNSFIEDPDTNLTDQYTLRAERVSVEGPHPEEFLQDIQKREVLEFRKYRNFAYISSRNHPATATPRKHKASSAGTTRKEADFAEKITDEMNSKFAEIAVKDFLHLFCRGPNLTKKQLKNIGDFSDLDTTEEAKMYPTLVRSNCR